MSNDQKNIVGVFEDVDFPELGLKGIKTKVDTGAYTGAIHCVEIYQEKSEHGNVLCFIPISGDNQLQKFTKYKVLPVTSSNGLTEQRYAINTTVVIRGESYPIRITLAHREGMRFPVLIGRRFLRRNKLMVDVSPIKK